jgi:hypothetical protein
MSTHTRIIKFSFFVLGPLYSAPGTHSPCEHNTSVWGYYDYAQSPIYIEKLNDLYIWSLNEKVELTSDNYPTRVPFVRQLSTILLRDVQNPGQAASITYFMTVRAIWTVCFDPEIGQIVTCDLANQV